MNAQTAYRPVTWAISKSGKMAHIINSWKGPVDGGYYTSACNRTFYAYWTQTMPQPTAARACPNCDTQH